MKKFVILLITVASIALSAAQDPSPPIWPNAFSIEFTEMTKILFTYTTNGSFYYDYANLRYRVDRQNGYVDR
jgi:hypothetical protein